MNSRVIGLALLLLVFSQPLIATNLDLSGDWYFSKGDQAAWSQPGFNHQSWPRIRVPGTLLPQLETSPFNIGWYRHRFHWQGGEAKDPLGLYLGPIHEADEVYLNGEKIGRTGTIGNTLGETVAAYRSPRLYPLAEGLLIEGENVIAIRAQVLGTAGGIITGPLLLGPLPVLLELRRQQERWALISQTAIVSVLLASALIAAFIGYWAGRDRAEHGWFFAFTLSASLVLGVESMGFYLSGFKTPVIQSLAYVLSYIAPVAFNRYIHQVFGQAWTTVPRALELGLLAMIPVILLGPLSWMEQANLFWIVAVTIILLLASRMAWLAIGRSVAGAKIWVINLLVLWLFFGVLIFVGTPANSPIRVDELGLGIFILGVLLAHARRFQAFSYRFQHLSHRLVDSVEDERKRVSKDIHDGVGQSLATIKLRLGMLQADDQNELKSITEDLGRAIDEMRSVVQGLHPLSLNRGGLQEAVQELAGRLRHQQNLTLNIDVEPMDLQPAARQHLLRMIQECVHNAIHHGEAHLIDIQARRQGSELVLSIHDDGHGMDDIPAEGTHGIGLISLNERAELLRGRIALQSSPGAGTRVEFRGPINVLREPE